MTISNQIIEVIDALCVKFGIAMDWTHENAIPYLKVLMQEFIYYEIWTSVIFIVLTLACLIAAIICNKKAKKAYDNCDCYDEDFQMFIYVFSCVMLVFLIAAMVIVTFIQAIDIVACITFPEKVVFDYISNLTTK